MNDVQFRAPDGTRVPAITAAQMREVDRVAMEEFNLGILQMMENAGRNLAQNVMDMLGQDTGTVTIMAGAGGNGGGGLCCARHLHNRGFQVHPVLDRQTSALRGAAARQLQIVQAAGLQPIEPGQASEAIHRADVVIDALIGYSLRGAPRGQVAELIGLCNEHATQVLSLDVPSGLDATTGRAPGLVVAAQRTLTLALPKTGLKDAGGDLYLADIGIPPEVYLQLGIAYTPPFRAAYWLRLERQGATPVP